MALIGTGPGGSVISNLSTLNLRILATAAANTTVSSSNANCTLSFATVDGAYYSPGRIECGYTVAPTLGAQILSVQTYAGVTLFAEPVGSSGLQVNLQDMFAAISTGIKVVLTAGGVGSVGYLNARPFSEK